MEFSTKAKMLPATQTAKTGLNMPGPSTNKEVKALLSPRSMQLQTCASVSKLVCGNSGVELVTCPQKTALCPRTAMSSLTVNEPMVDDLSTITRMELLAQKVRNQNPQDSIQMSSSIDSRSIYQTASAKIGLWDRPSSSQITSSSTYKLHPKPSLDQEVTTRSTLKIQWGVKLAHQEWMSTQTSLTSVFAHLAKSLMTSSKDVSVTENSKDRAEHRHHLHALNAHPTKLLARLTQQSASAQLVKSTMLPEEDASVMVVTKDSQRDQTQEAIHSLAKNVQQDKHSAELIQHNVSAHQVKRMTVLYKHAFAQRVNPMM